MSAKCWLVIRGIERKVQMKAGDEALLLSRLKELVAMAKRKKNVLEYKEIMDYLGEIE